MANACPVCGGNVETTIGEIFAHCPYCRAAVAVEDSAVIERYIVQSRLTPDAAARALRRWMHSPDPVAGLASKCKFADLPTAPIWLPVWYVRTREAPDKTKTKNQATGKRAAAAATESASEYLADKRSIPELHDRLIAPGAMERVRDGDGSHELPKPLLSLKTVLGRELAPNEAKKIALVHVPFYRLTYTYRNREYSAAVDAVTGEVRLGKFPTKNEAVFFVLSLVFFCAYWALNWWSRGATTDDEIGGAVIAYVVTFIVSLLSALITMAVV